MRCKKHPKYLGKTKPKATCKQCWDIFFKRQQNTEKQLGDLQLEHYRTEYEKLLKKKNATELIINEMKKVLSVMPKYRPFKVRQASNGYSEEQLVVLLSDSQIGTEVIGAEIGGFSDFNIDIFRYRLRLYLKGIMSTVERHRLAHPVKICNLFVIGDILENEIIFPSQKTFIDTHVMNQFFIAQYEISRFIASLARYFERVKVTMVCGNHGKVGNKWDHSDQINWEYILYRNIQSTLIKYKTIQWDIPVEWFSLPKIYDWRFLVVHSEDVVRWLNYPEYGLDRYDKRYTELMQKKGKAYEYLVYGHHHVARMHATTKGEQIGNGTFVGASRFTIKKLQVSGRPTQIIFFIHPRKSISSRYWIYLDEKDDKLLQQTMDESYNIKVPVPTQTMLNLKPF